MPLEHSSSPRRRWYRPAREPLPDEPGRLVVCALLSRARRARGCATAGDDRLETRAYALKRYLFRLGHAARSGRYATSIEQLVVGVAPMMGWGRAPRGGAARARFIRAHRKSVQRWLDDLEAAGLVAHEPERDDRGLWWRTQIVLVRAPEPRADELRAACERAGAWARRERRRRSVGRTRLAAIQRRSGVPSAATRAQLVRARRFGLHEARRRAAIERILAEHLTHPCGAPPTSAPSVAPPRGREETPTSDTAGPTALRAAQTLVSPPAVAVGTDAHAAVRPTRSPASYRRRGTAGIEESGRRVVALRRRAVVRDQLQRVHAARRVETTLNWPIGRPCPIGRLREAWVAYRHGLEAVAQGGSVTAGRRNAAIERRARHGIDLYEQHAAQRPAGWPRSGAAALLALASQGRAASFAGDVARLVILAKQMRASAEECHQEWLRRAQGRAARRAAEPHGPLQFRRAAPPRLVSPEHRRQHVRDRVLLDGHDPAAWPNAELAAETLGLAAPRLTGPDPFDELDGRGARAARYRVDRTAGRFDLPPDWTALPPTPRPTEDSPQ